MPVASGSRRKPALKQDLDGKSRDARVAGRGDRAERRRFVDNTRSASLETRSEMARDGVTMGRLSAGVFDM
jgi:hypothetical protein